ncbi:hypothetical protein LIER_17767 [Lithospermum erythrorhizon]|uniref:Uncharacterized protein n=1 Tax=Lithospermum erythrorhizon TaxID=34254 RepID=A0AAV3QE02_LITER
MTVDSSFQKSYHVFKPSELVFRPFGFAKLRERYSSEPGATPAEIALQEAHCFQEVKVVKKVASSPHPSSTMELPLCPTPVVNRSPHSSPIVANLNSSSFFPPNVDLPYEPPSSSLAGKRPSDEDVLQGKEKRSRAASGLSDPLRAAFLLHHSQNTTL